MNIEKFTAPLLSDEIEWKIQSVTKGQQPKTLIVPYINNRCIIHRLNTHIGIQNWQNELIPVSMNEYSETVNKSTNQVTVYKATHAGFISKLSIRVGEEWISRQDTAPCTDIEPIKGGASDAMKRCAVQFGVGIDLYDYPKIFLEGEHRFIPDWAQTLLQRTVADFHAGTLNRAAYVLREADVKKAAAQPAKPAPVPQPKPTKRETAVSMQKQQESAEGADFVFDIIDNTKRDIDLCKDPESFNHVEDNTYSDVRLPMNERIGLIKLSLIRRGGMVTKVEEAEIVKRRIAGWVKAKMLNTDDATAVLTDLIDTAETNGMVYATDRKFYYANELEAAA